MGPRGRFENCSLAKERSAGCHQWLQNGGSLGGLDQPRGRTSSAQQPFHPCLGGVGSSPEAEDNLKSSLLLPL